MYLQRLHIKNFRCFTDTVIDLPSRIVIIEGKNGSGKTSLLEIMHYLCYLRSFRTHSSQQLLQHGNNTFFIKAICAGDNEVQVGFSGKKKLVKVNKKAISSFKELLRCYRTVTVTEDDLFLVKGAPEVRRSFIDQVILLHDPDYVHTMKKFRSIVHNRNSLLHARIVDKTMYDILTEQLASHSKNIQEKRIAHLHTLQKETNSVIKQYCTMPLHVTFDYKIKKDVNLVAYDDEVRYRRSLFGAHLDDFQISFQDKNSKAFASRGQQKLIVLLLKIAQIRQYPQDEPIIFLLDDFMTDFDIQYAQILLQALSDLTCQLIFTSPVSGSILHEKLLEMGARQIPLTECHESLNS